MFESFQFSYLYIQLRLQFVYFAFELFLLAQILVFVFLIYFFGFSQFSQQLINVLILDLDGFSKEIFLLIAYCGSRLVGVTGHEVLRLGIK